MKTELDILQFKKSIIEEQENLLRTIDFSKKLSIDFMTDVTRRMTELNIKLTLIDWILEE